MKKLILRLDFCSILLSCQCWNLEVRQKSGELQKQYSQDLDISFMNECIHFRANLKDLPESI